MQSTPNSRSSHAWVVLGLLFAGSVVNYMDRAVLGVVMPQIRSDLALTNTDYGLAVNAFLSMYMIFYIVGGGMADRLGCRRTYLITVAFWSVASALHALARGLLSLSVLRALLGMGEGMFYPTALRGATEWFPPKNRAKAVGIILCGLSVGVLITPPIVAWLTIRYGWRTAFLLTGVSGFLLLLPWVIIHRKIRQAFGVADPAPALAESQQADASDPITLREVLTRRKYICLLAARSMTDTAWYFYLFWISGYFQDVRGFDLATIGRRLWIPYLSADVGALVGAWVSSALIARGFGLDRSRKVTLMASASLCVLGAQAYAADSSAWALGLISIGLFGHLAWSSNLHTAISEVAPPKFVALLYGITGASGTLLGAITQPLIGRSVDRIGYEPVFQVVAVLYLTAMALLMSAGKIERIVAHEPQRRQASGTASG